MKVQGIYFDFDGTLSDRFTSAYHMYRWIISEVSDLKQDDIVFEEIVQQCLYWDQYGHVNKSYVMNNLKKKYFSNLDVDKWCHLWYERFCDFQIPMKGSYETLAKLRKQYKLGILSNGDSHFQRKKIHALGFDDYVDDVIVCGDYGIQKPDHRIFEMAAKKMKLDCTEIAFVGDTFYKDISGAVKAGMKPVWMCVEREGLTDYPGIQIVHNYEEIENMFLNRDEASQ